MFRKAFNCRAASSGEPIILIGIASFSCFSLFFEIVFLCQVAERRGKLHAAGRDRRYGREATGTHTERVCEWGEAQGRKEETKNGEGEPRLVLGSRMR